MKEDNININNSIHIKDYYKNDWKKIHNNILEEMLSTNEIETVEVPYDVEVVAENLYVPWAIAIDENGKLYVTERSGVIRVIDNGKLNPQPLIKFEAPFVSTGEGGLLGIALDPNFKDNHYIYVYQTYTENNRRFNRVLRLVEQNDKAVIDKVILDKIPAATMHNGGRIKIGPDNKLYITTGDANNSSNAQNLDNTAGKILRIDLDGTIPEDNPIPNSPIYSYGLRNPQGLTWNDKNILYASEHGQSAHDEINIIIPGANYGWPLVQGNEENKDIKTQKPLISSENDTWAPSGIAYVKDGPWKGKLLVTNLVGKQLLVMTMNDDGTEVTNVEKVLKNQYGRLRDVVQAKDGSLYITTSNMDGRGNPGKFDDRVLHLIPKK